MNVVEKVKVKKICILCMTLISMLPAFSDGNERKGDNLEMKVGAIQDSSLKQKRIPISDRVHQSNKPIKKMLDIKAESKSQKTVKSTASKGKFFSSAFNFSHFAKVDNQTGLLSMSIPIGSIRGPGLLGPTFSLKLNYSAGSMGSVSNANGAFGMGDSWGFNLSRYRRSSTDYLVLGEGNSFPIDEAHTLRYHKLQDIRFSQLNSGDFKIEYKNGTIEYLNSNGYLFKLCNLTGKCLHFEYINDDNLLSQITDDSGDVLAKFSWPLDDSGTLTIKLRDDLGNLDSSKREYKISLDQSRVAQVSLPNNEKIQFDYCDTNNNDCGLDNIGVSISGLIYSIHYPTNLNYQFDYQALRGPGPAPRNYLIKAAIKSEQISSLGKVKATKTYSFKSDQNEHNYMGNESGQIFTYNHDILYDAAAGYTYSTKVDNGNSYTIYTYTHFHQLLTAKIYDENSRFITGKFFCYSDNVRGTNGFGYCNSGDDIDITNAPNFPEITFDDLYASYARPTQTFSVYPALSTLSKPRIVKTVTQYDDAGNLIEAIDPIGREKKITYCPIAGDESGCLPFNFKNYIKEIRKSSVSKFQTALKTYTYKKVDDIIKLDSVNFGYLQGLITPVYWKQSSLTYYDQNQDNPYFSLVKSHTLCLLSTSGDCKSGELNIESSTSAYSTIIKGKPNLYSTAVTKLNSKKMNYVSKYTQRLMKSTYPNGMTKVYTYDGEGNLLNTKICQTSSLTNCARLTAYDYNYPDLGHPSSPFYIIKTFPSGYQEKITFNGFGDPLMKYTRDNSTDSWGLAHKTMSYDSHGNLATLQNNSYGFSSVSQRKIQYDSLKTSFGYDILSRRIETKMDSGIRHEALYDDYHNRVLKFSIAEDNTISPISVIEKNAVGQPLNHYVLSTQNTDYSGDLLTKLTRIKSSITSGALNTTLRGDIKAFVDAAVTARKFYQSMSLTYDGFGRVDSKNTNGRLESFEYNRKGFLVNRALPEYIDHSGTKHNVEFAYSYNELTGKVTSTNIQEAIKIKVKFNCSNAPLGLFISVTNHSIFPYLPYLFGKWMKNGNEYTFSVPKGPKYRILGALAPSQITADNHTFTISNNPITGCKIS